MTLLLEAVARVVNPVGRATVFVARNRAEAATAERMDESFIVFLIVVSKINLRRLYLYNFPPYLVWQ